MEIKLSNLSKVFNNGKTREDVVAVDSIDLDIPSGKLIGLLGPSGCGKSTTLFMIAGLFDVTKGNIYFGDTDVTDVSAENRGIGLVFQNYALYPHMTVRQNIMFPLENIRIPRDEAIERTINIAKMVGIEDLLNRKPKALSGGQQQRVAIARALVKEPDVLLLDEPLSNLDARLRLQTRNEIKRIQRTTGITTVFVTHDQEEAMSISDEIVVMKLGVIQQVGKPQEIYRNPNNQFVAEFLGSPPINIFSGEIKKNKLLIGDVEIKDVKLKDQQVNIGIRPEHFNYIENEGIEVNADYVEVIGRDTSIISTLADQKFKAIIESDNIITENEPVNLLIKEDKILLFNPETGVRINE